MVITKAPEGYDVIGDIHGHGDELLALLGRLGYSHDGTSYTHENRQALFLVDFVDRGDQQKLVLDSLPAKRGNVSGGALVGGFGRGRLGVSCSLSGAFRSSPLLRPDGDPVGDGAAEDMGHSIVVFRRVEVQPGVLGISLQQALAFQATSHALANQLDQLFQLALGWRLNTLKAVRTIVATHVDAVQEQDMEVDKVN